ncbi:Transposable element Tcb2 transposase [Brachionus plicatilis]|uniref:Transposable element Tcb2 transposase n=1 Tax=Brachionus plicatilis TaxID=10195 RepID=A0A3M7RDR4_BRAPC|nr:Transposable element Tcb2 transposase [Brachionus plicatilis]
MLRSNHKLRFLEDILEYKKSYEISTKNYFLSLAILSTRFKQFFWLFWLDQSRSSRNESISKDFDKGSFRLLDNVADRSSFGPFSSVSVGPFSSVSVGPFSSVSVGPFSSVSVGPFSSVSVGPFSSVSFGPFSSVSVGPFSSTSDRDDLAVTIYSPLSVTMEKISELVKKLTLKGEKASEIRKKAIEMYPEEIVPTLGLIQLKALRARQYRLKKKTKRLYTGYFVRRYSSSQKVTAVIKEFIRNQIEISKGFTSAREIALEVRRVFSVKLALSTICYYRKKMGYVYRRARAMPNLNLAKKKQRELFAKRYKSFDTNRFIFADETKIEINTFPLYHFRQKTSKPSCVGVREKSSLKLFTSNLNQHSYKYILEYYLLPFVRTKFSREELDRCFLIQDNDPKHNSNLCSSFLRENGIRWLRTPANSADFNPIEMLWSDLKTFVRRKQCRSISELTAAIGEFEKNLNAAKCEKLGKHLKKVLTIVAKNKGEWSNE